MFVDISGVWAIEPRAAREYLRVYADVLSRRDAGEPLDKEAVEAATGKTLSNPSGSAVRGKVGVISVDGPIVKRGNMFSDVSGMASVDAISAQFDALNADSEISGILLDFNSPGGQIAGIADLADHIRADKQKPVVAFTSGTMASAAYWIGAAADQVVLAQQGMAGSIGAVMRFVDDSKAMEQAGLEDVEILDSRAPLKSADHTNSEVRAEMQQLVNDAGDGFRAAVAKLRGVSVDTVRKEFGRGGVMMGKRAVRAGLADRVATFDQVVRELSSGTLPQSKKEVHGMNLKDRIAALLHEDETVEAEAPAQAVTVTAAAPPVQVVAAPTLIDGKTPEQIKAELDAANAQLQALRAGQIEAQMASFTALYASKVPPAAMESVAAAYRASISGESVTPEAITAMLDQVTEAAAGMGPIEANGLHAAEKPHQVEAATLDGLIAKANEERGYKPVNGNGVAH